MDIFREELCMRLMSFSNFEDIIFSLRGQTFNSYMNYEAEEKVLHIYIYNHPTASSSFRWQELF